MAGDFAVTLGDGGPTVWLHRAILGARSDFFGSLLGSCARMAEGASRRLTLRLEPAPAPGAFLALARYLYTGRCDAITPAHTLDILALTRDDHALSPPPPTADEAGAAGAAAAAAPPPPPASMGGFLQLRSNALLRAQCERVLAAGLTTRNVAQLLRRAHDIGDVRAKRLAMAFVLANYGTTVDDDAFLPAVRAAGPELAFEILEAIGRCCDVAYRAGAFPTDPGKADAPT